MYPDEIALIVLGVVAALFVAFMFFAMNTDRLNKEACIAVGGDWASGCINIPPTMRPTTEE